MPDIRKAFKAGQLIRFADKQLQFTVWKIDRIVDRGIVLKNRVDGSQPHLRSWEWLEENFGICQTVKLK